MLVNIFKFLHDDYNKNTYDSNSNIVTEPSFFLLIKTNKLYVSKVDAGLKEKKKNYMCQVQSRPTQKVGQTEK